MYLSQSHSIFLSFSSYPQGDRPILGQIYALIAVICSVGVFPLWDMDGSYDFMCKGNHCFPLKLTSQEYYADDGASWGAARAGAIMAVLASMVGFVGLSLLMTATCFPLNPRRLLSITVLFGVATLLQAFTFVAGVADPCRTGRCGDLDIKTGALFSIFAIIFYVISTYVVCSFYVHVTYGHDGDADANSNAHRRNSNASSVADLHPHDQDHHHTKKTPASIYDVESAPLSNTSNTSLH